MDLSQTTRSGAVCKWVDQGGQSKSNAEVSIRKKAKTEMKVVPAHTSKVCLVKGEGRGHSK